MIGQKFVAKIRIAKPGVEQLVSDIEATRQKLLDHAKFHNQQQSAIAEGVQDRETRIEAVVQRIRDAHHAWVQRRMDALEASALEQHKAEVAYNVWSPLTPDGKAS